MTVPSDLNDLCIKQHTGRRPEDGARVAAILEGLGANPASELGQVTARHNLAMLASETSSEELIDPLWPDGSMARTTAFVHETWELPKNFIPLSSIEGEGLYLYDRDTGAVWDFELAYREDFLTGNRRPMFESFFEFLRWYVAE